MKKSKTEIISSVKTDYNRQLCKYCGHSMIFMPYRESLICHHCGRKNYNKTKGHFFREMYGKLNVRDREG